jgi:hypothetical protein
MPEDEYQQSQMKRRVLQHLADRDFLGPLDKKCEEDE